MQYIIGNDKVKFTIESKGCELVSAVRASDGGEYMWSGNPDAWKRHSPLLFPLIGRYRDDKVRHNGKEYEMSQHGFARDMEFELVEKTDTSITMKLIQTEETLIKFPFNFILECNYTVVEPEKKTEDTSLRVSWKVTNTNDETMYFSIGGHPAFVCPDKNVSMTDCEMAFYYGRTRKIPCEVLMYKLLNEKGLVESKGYGVDLAVTDYKWQIKDDMFDMDALVFEGYQSNKAELLHDGKAFVTVSFDAPVFGVWSPARKNVPFVCIEPWYGRADSESFAGELQDRDWGNALSAGSVFERGYTITFHM